MKVVKLFDGKYEATEDGKIFSNVRVRKELIGKVSKCGYRVLLFTVNRKRLYRLAHRIIAQSFIPNPENKPHVNHINGIKTDNRVENLEWCTRSENGIHARDNQLSKHKINMEIAEKIREHRKIYGLTHVELGEMFSLKKSQIGYILQNKVWKK